MPATTDRDGPGKPKDEEDRPWDSVHDKDFKLPGDESIKPEDKPWVPTTDPLDGLNGTVSEKENQTSGNHTTDSG